MPRPCGGWVAEDYWHLVRTERLRRCKRVLQTMLKGVSLADCLLLPQPGHAFQCSSTPQQQGDIVLMSYAGVLDGFLVRMCRECTAVQHYDGLHDSIFSFSNASLFTYELCFNYTDSMLLMRLPFASHWQQLLANYRRSGQAERLCARGTHRYDAGNASACLQSQCCLQC